MKMQIVVMGDLLGSSLLPEAHRVGLQTELIEWLANLQKKFGDSLVTDASVTAGDAFQVVVADAVTVADLVWETWTAPDGIDLRLGIGRGEIFGEFLRDSRLMNGPAFRNARRAVSQDSYRICFDGFGAEGDSILNGIAALLDAHLDSLAPKQKAVVQRVHKGRIGKEIAAELGVTPQAVSRSIQSAHWSEFESGERGFKAALSLFASEDGSKGADQK